MCTFKSSISIGLHITKCSETQHCPPLFSTSPNSTANFPIYHSRPLSPPSRYLDNYVASFGLQEHIFLRRRVDSAEFDSALARWRISAANVDSGEVEEYEAQFLVVATGENDEPVLPVGIAGLDGFEGEAVHSNQFRTGKAYDGLDVLVVGSGNSGMEIAYDLADGGARTAIVVRSPVRRPIVSFIIFLFSFFCDLFHFIVYLIFQANPKGILLQHLFLVFFF